MTLATNQKFFPIISDSEMFILNRFYPEIVQNVFLLDMPDLVMKNILRYCGTIDRLRLRKVCCSLRNFIDMTPQFTLRYVTVYIHPTYVYLNIGFNNFIDNMNLKYFKYHEGCVITFDGRFFNNRSFSKIDRKVWLKCVDFMTAFEKDFKTLIQSQESLPFRFMIWVCKGNPNGESVKPDFNLWNIFDIIKNNVWNVFGKQDKNSEDSEALEVTLMRNESKAIESIAKVLKGRRRALRTEQMCFKVYNPESVLKIIPFIAPRDLKRLNVDGERSVKLDIGEIMKHEIWKNIENLYVSGFYVTAPMSSYAHINHSKVTYNESSVEDLIALKEAIANSTNGTSIMISKNEEFDRNELIAAFGDPVNYQGGDTWFFKSKYKNKHLHTRKVGDGQTLWINEIESEEIEGILN